LYLQIEATTATTKTKNQNEKMKSQILILKTITGRKVWTDGRMRFKMKSDSTYSMPVQSRPINDSELNRQRTLEKAQQMIGKKCVWIDGGETSFIGI